MIKENEQFWTNRAVIVNHAEKLIERYLVDSFLIDFSFVISYKTDVEFNKIDFKVDGELFISLSIASLKRMNTRTAFDWGEFLTKNYLCYLGICDLDLLRDIHIKYYEEWKSQK